jgi:hypothetical protein
VKFTEVKRGDKWGARTHSVINSVLLPCAIPSTTYIIRLATLRSLLSMSGVCPRKLFNSFCRSHLTLLHPQSFNTVPTNMQPLISIVLCKQKITVRVLPITKNQIEQRYRSNLDPRNHSQTGLANVYSHSNPKNCQTRPRRVELTVKISEIFDW